MISVASLALGMLALLQQPLGAKGQFIRIQQLTFLYHILLPYLIHFRAGEALRLPFKDAAACQG